MGFVRGGARPVGGGSRGRRRSPSRVLSAAAAGSLLALGVAAIPPAAAVHDDGLFELEADVDDDSPSGAPDDWATVHAGDDNAFVTTGAGFAPEAANATIFTGGGSKDDLDVSRWKHKNGSVPDKDDIVDAYAAAYSGPDGPDSGTDPDTYVYFGMDRFAVQGSANVGFWFFQDDVAPVTGGTFSGLHQVGDLLVLSEFDEGGTGVTIKVLEWVGSGGDEGGGTLQTLYGGTTGVSADCDAPPSDDAVCANVNTGTIPDAQIPWDYVGKGGARDMVAGVFFEGGINLSTLFSATPCFTNFLAETRSSFEVNAVLKDFFHDSFPLCDASIQIAGDDTNGIGEPHTFTVTANQVFAGASTPAPDGTVVTVTLTASNGAAVEPISDTCADPGTVGGTCSVSFTSNTAGTIVGHAEASIVVGDDEIAVETDGTGSNSGDATKIFVDGSVRWLKHDDQGNLLGGATFKLCQTHGLDTSTTPDTFVDITDDCVEFVDNSAPDTDATAGEIEVVDLPLGRYTVQETAAPAGYTFDPTDVRTVELTLEPGPKDATISTPFINTALFKLIVVTCNTATEELVDSTVTLGTDTRETVKASELPSGVTEAALCGLAGANYDNLTRGTYAPSVELPDEAPLYP